MQLLYGSKWWGSSHQKLAQSRRANYYRLLSQQYSVLNRRVRKNGEWAAAAKKLIASIPWLSLTILSFSLFPKDLFKLT